MAYLNNHVYLRLVDSVNTLRFNVQTCQIGSKNLLYRLLDALTNHFLSSPDLTRPVRTSKRSTNQT